MLDVLHVICTRLRPGHLSVRVGDSWRHCEEIVKKKKSRIAPLNAIIIIIIIIMIFSMHTDIAESSKRHKLFHDIKKKAFDLHITLVINQRGPSSHGMVEFGHGEVME